MFVGLPRNKLHVLGTLHISNHFDVSNGSLDAPYFLSCFEFVFLVLGLALPLDKGH